MATLRSTKVSSWNVSNMKGSIEEAVYGKDLTNLLFLVGDNPPCAFQATFFSLATLKSERRES